MRRPKFHHPIALSLAVVLALLLGACATKTPAPEVGLPSPSGHQAAPLSTGGTTSTEDTLVIDLVKRVLPSVVNVSSEGLENTGFGFQQGVGTGTGFVIRSDGIIVTNFHVVEGAQKITVTTPDPGSKKYDARVIGGDPETDVAVLKIEAQNLPAIPLGSSADLQRGETVVAIGYALALEGGPTVTRGIVSALDHIVRDVADPNCQDCKVVNGFPSRTYSSVIQTDAAINPGNSGGPLLNLNGEVVGINSAGAGASQADNIGFAIAVDSARTTIQDAVDHPSEPQAYLGVLTQTVTSDVANQFQLSADKGAYVIETAPGGPAEKAGVKQGDVMISFNGITVDNNDDFAAAIDKSKPGDQVEMEFIRGSGQNVKITATLGTKPTP